jgi:uncharacterized metal-binding protein
MKYGITLLGNRVSPRCTYADSVLFVSKKNNRTTPPRRVPVNNLNLPDLCDLLLQNRVDILICGGITNESKEFLTSRNLAVIENVASTTDKIIQGLKSDQLKAGFGLSYASAPEDTAAVTNGAKNEATESLPPQNDNATEPDNELNCTNCSDKTCLSGKPCLLSEKFNGFGAVPNRELMHMLDAAADISSERERTLCRLSELIYFCLEMKYERLGIAYCVDLEEPAEILARVLRRFFTVHTVCCKIGGKVQPNPMQSGSIPKNKYTKKNIACNPWGQARALNKIGTDFNIMVGLCMGADCVFAQGSQAPATALFVKDRSLANNPIGAVYSEYYLKEAVRTNR